MSETIGSIASNQTVNAELVLSERVVTSEFMITEIHESIRDRYVRVDLELGPFTTDERGGQTFTRGASRRSIVAWDKEAYDALRDTWRNEDLIARVKSILEGTA